MSLLQGIIFTHVFVGMLFVIANYKQIFYKGYPHRFKSFLYCLFWLESIIFLKIANHKLYGDWRRE